MATWLMFSFQDSNSPYMDNLIMFHNMNMMVMMMVITLILFILLYLMTNKYCNRFLKKNHTIEIIWAIIPMFNLMYICFPSLKILYYIDEIFNPFFTIKAISHQWYWSYEYPEFSNFKFDSHMTSELKNLYDFRLLYDDNRLIVRMKLPMRLITTSTDVIHAWTNSSLCIKMDSIPGRINQSNLYSMRPGIFFCQCSEICGINHWLMRIMTESTSFHYFLKSFNKNK